MASVAVAGAGVLAVAPTLDTAASTVRPHAHVTAHELSAFENPLALWGTTISNSLTTAGGLGHNIVAQTTALGQALGNPALHAEIIEVLFSSVTNPLPFLTETLKFPFTYGARIGAGLEAASAASWGALAKLPEAIVTAAGLLLQGQFLAAYGQINHWFLVDALSEGRAGLLDALRVPGDFLESIGLHPLARILGTSWMDEGTAGPGYGPGLLSRGVIGNLGRALFAPPITAIFQTVEILDRAREALFSGDLVTLVSEVVNAPAKILNAFLNGYVPAFVDDPDSPFPPDGPGRNFPGLFSPTGTLDFLFVQLPREIARALNLQRPQPEPEADASASSPTTEVSSTSAAFSDDAATFTIDTAGSGSATDAQDTGAPEVPADTDTVTDTDGQNGGDGTEPPVDTDGDDVDGAPVGEDDTDSADDVASDESGGDDAPAGGDDDESAATAPGLDAGAGTDGDSGSGGSDSTE
ncbi:hypothetical protein ACTWP6_13295 [Mycobacterium sp. 4D054]|uniref:hypothetical protein n=1 Tax=Mycobacterium sp. 4D054 TaxID=3457440 RepID=UPI003FCFF7E9